MPRDSSPGLQGWWRSPWGTSSSSSGPQPGLPGRLCGGTSGRGEGDRDDCSGIICRWARWGLQGESTGVERGGACGRNLQVSPSPAPAPDGDIRHGPLHRDRPEEEPGPPIPGLPLVLSGNPSPESLRARLPTGYHHALPPPLSGGGGAPNGRAGRGVTSSATR
jgi:hypothetical protein